MTTTALDELVTTLLWEGYALYPYTPGATKNATPTPFGIVYPPAYAAGSPTTHDRIRMQGILRAERAADATLALSVVFLEPSGERHEGVERRVELPATTLAELVAADGLGADFTFERVQGRVRMSAQLFDHDQGLARITVCVHNTTEAGEGLDRAGALRASMLSTHPIARCGEGACFISLISPPEELAGAVMACNSINTFPLLATDQDDVLLGTAIMLHDHPQIAPESRGDLFDGTEIEEALLLHVLALSDGEREQMALQDPKIREMIARAAEATPEDFERLRGRVTISDPPPVAEAEGDVRGEQQIEVEGRRFRRGDHVRLCPPENANAQDHLLESRMATIERIYIDYEDQVHLGVTVDDDPGQQVMRDIGRYLYFKPAEVEVIGA